MDNYSQLVDRISLAAKLPREDIERKVEAKRAKLSGLVSKEGAAQIVAAELGINFDKERMKISELVQGMKKANVIGKILEVISIRSYNKNGREGKVANLMLADESNNIKTVFWDTNHIALLEQNKIKAGDVIEVSNAQVRNGELHLSSFSDIRLSKETIGNVVEKKQFMLTKIDKMQSGQSVRVRAVVVQVFEPRLFEVCPECGKRVIEEECKIHGKIVPKKRALLNVVLDDGTDSIRSVLFGDNIYQLGLSEEEVFNIEKFMEKKNSILGEEKFFIGNVKTNSLYNTMEFNVEKVEEVNVSELMTELEKKG
ncbi:MAG: hypothetical protein WCK29_01965 [archaeon]